MCDGESDPWLLPLSLKPSEGLIDVQDGMMGEESMMSLGPFYSRFHSRFAPDFTPDSRSNVIALNRTRLDGISHHFNANIVHGLTPSHSIAISTDRPFKGMAY